MVDWGSAVIDRLEDWDAFWTPIGGRVDWSRSPDGTAYPRAVLNTVGDDRPDHYEGADLRETRLQLDVYSRRSSAAAVALAEEAIAALQPEAERSGVRFCRAQVEGPFDSGDQGETDFAYRARVDFLLLHAPIDGDDPGPDPEPGGSLVWGAVEW